MSKRARLDHHLISWRGNLSNLPSKARARHRSAGIAAIGTAARADRLVAGHRAAESGHGRTPSVAPSLNLAESSARVRRVRADPTSGRRDDGEACPIRRPRSGCSVRCPGVSAERNLELCKTASARVKLRVLRSERRRWRVASNGGNGGGGERVSCCTGAAGATLAAPCAAAADVLAVPLGRLQRNVHRTVEEASDYGVVRVPGHPCSTNREFRRKQ